MAPNVDLLRMVRQWYRSMYERHPRWCVVIPAGTRSSSLRAVIMAMPIPFGKEYGSGLATLIFKPVPGVTAGVSNDTLTCAYNDLAAVERFVDENKGQVAAIIREPVAGTWVAFIPQPGFL